MSFEQFEKIYETARKLVHSTTLMFDISDNFTSVPDDLYVEILRLHNVSVDFINAYKKCTNDLPWRKEN